MLLGNQVVKTGEGGGEVWGLKARWHLAAGDLTMCREAALKQVRAFQVMTPLPSFLKHLDLTFTLEVPLSMVYTRLQFCRPK